MNNPTSPWLSPPQNLLLGNDEVHIWRVALDQPSWIVQALWSTLQADEQARAQRFVFPKDRTHSIVARGALRTILAHYVSAAPDHLQFRYNEYGKPTLNRLYANTPLFFNVSHSHGLALIAFARHEEVGVDIEYMDPRVECAQIADHFFSPGEVKKLLSIPSFAQPDAFFNCWTRKEAYIKARGMGISLGLNNFDVSLLPGEPVSLLAIREGNQDVASWSLHALSPAEGYKAALAIKTLTLTLRLWQWQPSDLLFVSNPAE